MQKIPMKLFNELTNMVEQQNKIIQELTLVVFEQDNLINELFLDEAADRPAPGLYGKE